jgi:hypothetical protein
VGAHEKGFASGDAASEIAEGADLGPAAEFYIVAEGGVEVDRAKVADANVTCDDGVRANDDTLAEADLASDDGLWVYEGDETGSAGEEGDGAGAFDFGVAQGEGKDIVGTRAVILDSAEDGHGHGVFFESVKVVVDEACDFPFPTVFGALAGPEINLTTETAGSYDNQALHVGLGGSSGILVLLDDGKDIADGLGLAEAVSLKVDAVTLADHGDDHNEGHGVPHVTEVIQATLQGKDGWLSHGDRRSKFLTKFFGVHDSSKRYYGFVRNA